MGLVGYVARFSATLRGALHRVQRYGRLFTEAVEFRLEEGQREVALAMPHAALGPGRAVAEGYRINEITAAIDWNQRCDWIVRRLAAQTPAAKVWEDSMLITIVDNHVYVRLSRRNPRQLDAILDEPDVRNRCLVRKDKNGTSLVLQVEDDADHYMGCDPGPGYGDLRPTGKKRVYCERVSVADTRHLHIAGWSFAHATVRRGGRAAKG